MKLYIFRFIVSVACLSVGVASWAASADPDVRIVESAMEALQREKLHDAHHRHVKTKPWLAFDEESVETLVWWKEHRDIPEDELEDLMQRAGSTTATEAAQRFLFLGPEARARVAREIGVGLGEDPTAAVVAAYQHLARRETLWLKRMTDGERLDWVEVVVEDLEASITTRGRRLRQIALLPAAPFVYGWLGQHILREYKGPKEPEFERYRVYAPNAGRFGSEGRSNPGTEKLLKRYAPVLVQEELADPSYPEVDDRIGKLGWAHNAKGESYVGIDIRQPAVYAYAQSKHIGGDELVQLVYTHWYPEHPPLKRFDAEAGAIEGLTLRITLDHEYRPLVYETIYNCGCYHRLYVSARLEQAARKAFGEPQKGKRYSIEKKMPGKIDLIVLNALADPTEEERPILYCWASYHLPGKVDIGLAPEVDGGKPVGTVQYELLPYEALESAPLNGKPRGIFDSNGLVFGADRMESTLLSPTGLFHAGTPRQRGTQLIHFDQANFEDPDLFLSHLRWPGVPRDKPEKR